MISKHPFGGSVVFREEVDSMSSTIIKIDTIPSGICAYFVESSCLELCHGGHVKVVLNITKRYDELVEEIVHRGVIQRIQFTWSNEGYENVLANVYLLTNH